MKVTSMNKSNVNIFEKLSGQLLSIYEEISLLSKKNPNDAVNKFKLKFVNVLLVQSNDYLAMNISHLKTLLTLMKMIFHKTVMLSSYFPNIYNALRS